MRNFKVVIEYEGTDYCGFQSQPNVPTVQGELERVLSQIVHGRVIVYGSGRTDAGVHAAGQVISFRTEGTIPSQKLCVAMNSMLPKSISAVEACEVEKSFHARYSAKSRLYRYEIVNSEVRSALRARYAWHVRCPLNAEEMQKAAECLVGVHDFSAFACADKDCKSTIRRVHSLDVRREGDRVIVEARANAFLRSMVRVIVGTLVEVGLGARSWSDMLGILDSKDRTQAGKTAPPQGLCLVEVEY